MQIQKQEPHTKGEFGECPIDSKGWVRVVRVFRSFNDCVSARGVESPSVLDSVD